MDRWVVWAARAGVGALAVLALLGAADPHHDARRLLFRPDGVEHAAYAYGLALGSFLALPRARPLWVAGALAALGWGVEALQGLNIIDGDAQAHDAVADLVGVALAAAPFLAGRRAGSAAA